MSGRFLATGVVSGVVVLIGVLWVLPYFLIPESPQGIAEGLLGFVDARSGVLEFLLVHGWMLAIFAVFVWNNVEDRFDRTARKLALLGIIVFLGILLQAAAFAIVLPIAGVGWYLLRVNGDVGFETVLLLAGAGIVLLVEILFVQEMASVGRFNTVFKSYAHVWIIWGIAAGCMFARLTAPTVSSGDNQTRAWLRTGALLVLVVSTSIYGAVALSAHFEESSVETLDATHTFERQHPLVWEATQYLDELPGQPNIVSAPGSPYRWQAAPSSFTGIPTLATGLHHQRSFHGKAAIGTRVDALSEIYTGSTDSRAALLHTYDVRYIWVGPWVREEYGSDLQPVSETPGIEVVFDNQMVQIYRVHPDDLPT